MSRKCLSMALAATLITMPVAGAFARQNNPAGNLGSNRSSTAGPGTADNPAASGTYTGDTRSTGNSVYRPRFLGHRVKLYALAAA